MAGRGSIARPGIRKQDCDGFRCARDAGLGESGESGRLHSADDFDKISAAGRIRALLASLQIPLTLPDELDKIPKVPYGEAYDGPGFIAWVRNSIVHATSKNRRRVSALSSTHLHECGQLAIEYLELALLRLVRYEGHYWSRSAEENRVVPWSNDE